MNSPSSKYLYGRASTFGTALTMTETEEESYLAQLDPRGKSRTTKRPALMTHEERRRLIERPLPTVRVCGRAGAWGGVYIRDSVPTEGRRVWQERPEDEEWCRNRYEEK